MKLPNAEKAVVEREKIEDYLLNAAHPDNGGKAAFFAGLGFRRANWEELAKALRMAATQAEITQNMEGNMIKEHDRIVLKNDIPAEGSKAGDVGTVVHVYRDGLAYEVEFTTLAGDTAAVVTVEAPQVRAVHCREITHARELQTT
jgi:hypothetical protein